MRHGIMLKMSPSTNWLLLTGRAKKAALEILTLASQDNKQKKNHALILELIRRIESGEYDLQIHEMVGEKDYICITSDRLPAKEQVFGPILSICYTRIRIFAVRMASLFT